MTWTRRMLGGLAVVLLAGCSKGGASGDGADSNPPATPVAFVVVALCVAVRTALGSDGFGQSLAEVELTTCEGHGRRGDQKCDGVLHHVGSCSSRWACGEADLSSLRAIAATGSNCPIIQQRLDT